MATILTDDQVKKLSRFLNRRNNKAGVLSLFADAIDEHELKRGDLTQNKNATYQQLARGIADGLSKDWLEDGDVVSLLDESEIAGRQHVCIFLVPSASGKSVRDALAKPKHSKSGRVDLDDFWTVPQSSFAQVLTSTANSVLVKIIAKRRYWQSEVTEQNADEEWIHRWIVEERSAIVVKFDKKEGLLQIRVPPKERQSQAETGKSVYDFALDVLPRHYAMGSGSWFAKLKLFPISDSYNKILENFDDYLLRHDTPESATARSRCSKKGSIKKAEDLRKDPMWKFGKGYARKTMRGLWAVDDDVVYTHLNIDKVKKDGKTEFEYARVFFPHHVNDQQVDYAIKRIREHI